ncbi:chitinase N-terminal domain-containing protein [Paenibacillus taiwanensis]|uniref:chitinase N-terminal domain-containing protein n=1 Tax=Paenibacillus taiwanensis TaxID=401638 RepID=UPI0003FA6AA4|nr:chitinase N-terminal domain-containing protein [Paenibacillus taiwanensis]
MFKLKKTIIWAITAVLVTLGAAATATSKAVAAVDPPFTANATYTGKDTNGLHHVQISWDNLGDNAQYYNVYRYPTLYPWGGEAVQGCTNLTTTSCESLSVEKGQFRYIVKAKLVDGREISNQSGNTLVDIHSYTGAPATPVIYTTSTAPRTYTVGFNITSGNNADIWELYENGVLVNLFQGFLLENGQEPQHASRTFYDKSSGTYQYVIKLSNAYGTAVSQTITVVVP